MDDWEQPDSILADANRSMFREALLSYRLIFGQNLNSRRLFRFQEKKRASKDGYTDQLLVRLCRNSKDISVMSEDHTLYEQAFYDSVVDFPHYGPRLENLQRYVSARKSRNIKDLWQDRRDPERWTPFCEFRHIFSMPSKTSRTEYADWVSTAPVARVACNSPQD
ncbi:MAG: hypothetical protein Q9192_005669 [Flavoplaca navasiana]